MNTKQPYELWNETGLAPVSTPPALADNISLDDAVQKIREWFLENFEDPVHSSPYDGREGGYQYIYGGPYDAREIIEIVFTGVVSEDAIQAAIDEVEGEATDWTSNSNRHLPPEEDEPELELTASDAHDAMLQDIKELEAYLTEVDIKTPTIGHNNPPEGIESTPWTQLDRQELDFALATLKTQPVKPGSAEIAQAKAAASTVKSKGDKIRAWLAKAAGVIGTGIAASFASELGKSIYELAWPKILSAMEALGASVQFWLSLL